MPFSRVNFIVFETFFFQNSVAPIDATPAERDRIVSDFRSALSETGLVVPMATTNLFSDPVFKDGAFTSNDAKVRAYALQKTMNLERFSRVTTTAPANHLSRHRTGNDAADSRLASAADERSGPGKCHDELDGRECAGVSGMWGPHPIGRATPQTPARPRRGGYSIATE